MASTKGTSLDTGLKLDDVQSLNEYWEEARGLYAPFESGQKTGSSDVYFHEMPGGQVRLFSFVLKSKFLFWLQFILVRVLTFRLSC